MADKFKIHGAILEDCIEYLHNCGEVIWLQNHPKLKQLIFHKPLKLIEALSGIFHHDLEHILNFQENRTFSSIGKLSEVGETVFTAAGFS